MNPQTLALLAAWHAGDTEAYNRIILNTAPLVLINDLVALYEHELAISRALPTDAEWEAADADDETAP